MDYEDLVEGAKKYPLEDNIYDLASLMVSRHGIGSDESIAGIFTLIFSWNRFYYTPPNRRPKSINVLDLHVKQFKQTVETMKKYILALKDKTLESTDFDEILQETQDTVGNTIRQVFSSFAKFLGATGASKALHLLLPRLVVMWDTQIRIDYELQADAHHFIRFQRTSKALLESIRDDFVQKHKINRDAALQEILRLKYGEKPKTLPKLIDEFNWATRGKSKHRLLNY